MLSVLMWKDFKGIFDSNNIKGYQKNICEYTLCVRFK